MTHSCAWHSGTWHTAREASWRWAFDPCAPLLFILYHYFEQNLHFGLVPEPPQVLSARSFLVVGFDTLNIPRSFSCGLVCDNLLKRISKSIRHRDCWIWQTENLRVDSKSPNPDRPISPKTKGSPRTEKFQTHSVTGLKKNHTYNRK